jgi:hypothetical protein
MQLFKQQREENSHLLPPSSLPRDDADVASLTSQMSASSLGRAPATGPSGAAAALDEEEEEKAVFLQGSAVESDHFRERTAQADRPTSEDAYATAASGSVLMAEQRNGRGNNQRVVKEAVFQVQEHDEGLGTTVTSARGVKVVFDKRAGRSGRSSSSSSSSHNAPLMITTYYRLRMQLILIAPEEVANAIVSHESALRPALRHEYPRCHGSGVSTIVSLSGADMAAHATSPSEAAWAGAIVPEETKRYSIQENGGDASAGTCGLNPDFRALYLAKFGGQLQQALAGSGDASTAMIPTIHWGEDTTQVQKEGESRKAKTPVVFLTVVLPRSVSLRLVADPSQQPGINFLSVTTALDRHPTKITFPPRTDGKGSNGGKGGKGKGTGGKGNSNGKYSSKGKGKGRSNGDGNWRSSPRDLNSWRSTGGGKGGK